MRNVRASSAAARASDVAMRAALRRTVSATTATPFACLTDYRVAERTARRRDGYNAEVDLKTIDADVAGDAVRLVSAGLPPIAGGTLDERRGDGVDRAALARPKAPGTVVARRARST
jgi:hypothetical protein